METYNERLRCLFDNWQIKFEEETVNIIVSHLFVMDSLEEGSERSIQLGGSYLADPDIFPKLADYVALGHIHRPQIFRDTRIFAIPVHRSSIGKEKNVTKNRCCVWISEEGESIEVEPIDLKQYKPIQVWRCTSISEAIMVCEENRDKNCWVYLEIETERAILEDEIQEDEADEDRYPGNASDLAGKRHRRGRDIVEGSSVSGSICRILQTGTWCGDV